MAEEQKMSEERRFSAGLLLGLAGLNSFDGALAAMKRGIPYECIRGALSKDLRHFFETPIDELIKEQENKVIPLMRQDV